MPGSRSGQMSEKCGPAVEKQMSDKCRLSTAPPATFFNVLFLLSWSLEQASRRWKKLTNNQG